MMLSSASFLAALAIGQAAGPTGVVKTEIKTMADVYAKHESVPVPEYLRSIVLITFRTSDAVGASRIETVLGPERVMVKMSDLDGTNIHICGTTDEFWAVDHKVRTFLRIPLAGFPVTTEYLRSTLFGEMNKDADKKFKNDESPFQLSMMFHPNGMPSLVLDKPMEIREKKDVDGGVEYVCGASSEKGEAVAVVLTDKDGRVSRASYEMIIDGYSVELTVDRVVYSTEPVARDLFKFPEDLTKGYTKGELPKTDGS